MKSRTINLIKLTFLVGCAFIFSCSQPHTVIENLENLRLAVHFEGKYQISTFTDEGADLKRFAEGYRFSFFRESQMLAEAPSLVFTGQYHVGYDSNAMGEITFTMALNESPISPLLNGTWIVQRSDDEILHLISNSDGQKTLILHRVD